MKLDDYNVLVENASFYTGILLSTLWNQSGNIVINGNRSNIQYNEYCPYEPGTTRRAVTGCTNTAAAQIINYYIEKKALDLQLVLTVNDEYYSYKNGISIEITQSGSAAGTVSFSKINSLLSSYSCTSAEDIAALNYACGVVQEAEYSAAATSTSWNTDLFRRAGFDSVNEMNLYNSSDVYWGSKGSISNAGFEVLIENLQAGQVVGTSHPGHALVIDGYNPQNDTFHINFGWGNSSSTRWYTRAEINNANYYEFIYDLAVDGKYTITVNDTDIYGTGTLVRAVEIAKGDYGANQIRFTSSTNEKTLNLLNYFYLSNGDIRFSQCDMDLLFDSNNYGFYYSSVNGSISFEDFSGSLIVNGSSSCVVGGTAKNFEFYGDGALVYSGTTSYSASSILNTLQSSQKYGTSISSWLLDDINESFSISGSSTILLDNSSIVVGEILLGGGDYNDVITVVDNSILYGDIYTGGGNDIITVDSSSSISGRIRSYADICFELTEHNTEAAWTTNYSWGFYSYSPNVTVDLYDAAPGVYSLISGTDGTSYLKNITVDVTGSGFKKFSLSCNGTAASDQAELFWEDHTLKLRVKNYYAANDTAAPTVPVNATASVSRDQATFSWSSSTDNIEVHHYQLRYGKSSSLTGSGITVKGTDTKISGLTAGKYYYQVRACDSNGNYSAWSSAKSFNILGEATDLIITDYNVSSTNILTTQSLTLKFNVMNSGNKKAAASVLSVYDGNTKLGQINVKSLSGGESKAYSYTIAAGKLTTGSRKIFLVADSSKSVSEGNEDNNKAYRTIKVSVPSPDLCIQDYEISDSYIKQTGSVKLSFKYANKGNTASGSSVLKVYDGNTLLRTFTMGSVAAGSYRNGTVTLKGSELAKGARKLYLVVDANRQITESNEDNNKAYRTVNVNNRPDLCIKNYEISSTSVAKDGNLKLSFKYANTDSTASGTSILKVYDGNTLLRTFTMGSVAAGSYRNCTVTLKGSELGNGARKIYLVVDANKQVIESNEDNNKAYRTVKVGKADLCIQDYEVSATSVSKNGSVKLSFKYANKGTVEAGASVLKVYDGNTLLRTFTMGSVAAGSYRNGTVTLKGSELETGLSYIHLVADADDRVNESDENNNDASRSITVTADGKLPDLEVSNLTLSSTSIKSNESLTLTFDIDNTGNAVANSSYAYIYDGNRYLGAVEISHLAMLAAGDWWQRCTYTIPGGTLSAGSHNIYVVADGGNTVSESDENNNKAYKSVTVVDNNKMPNLKVSNLTLSSTDIKSNESLTLTFQIRNSGSGDAAPSYAYIYDNDTCLGKVYVRTLTGDISDWIADCTYTIPGGTLSAGSHNIYVVADGGNTVSESDESDNRDYAAVNVEQQKYPDLEPHTPREWEDCLILSNVENTNTDSDFFTQYDTIFVDWAFHNNQDVGITEEFYTALYVDDVLVKTTRCSELPTGYYGYTEDYELGTLSAGYHEITFMVDYGDNITETDENNNCISKVISIA